MNEPIATQPRTVLILGGTSEGYELASALDHTAQTTGWRVVTSLAGRTANPRQPAGTWRSGGFGGVAGLADYLVVEHIAAVIDATHPFASTMGWHAARACTQTRTPLLRLQRPPWQPEAGDNWHPVADWESACKHLEQLDVRCVLLALGRQELLPFCRLHETHVVVRLVGRPEPAPPFRSVEWIEARGPFDLATERALLDSRSIEAIVCKNSGGSATAAKLTAARERALPVIMRERPARPTVATVATVAHALAWLYGLKTA